MKRTNSVPQSPFPAHAHILTPEAPTSAAPVLATAGLTAAPLQHAHQTAVASKESQPGVFCREQSMAMAHTGTHYEKGPQGASASREGVLWIPGCCHRIQSTGAYAEGQMQESVGHAVRTCSCSPAEGHPPAQLCFHAHSCS